MVGLGTKRPVLLRALGSSLNSASFRIFLTYRMSRAGFVTALSGCLLTSPMQRTFVDNPGAVTRPAGVLSFNPARPKTVFGRCALFTRGRS